MQHPNVILNSTCVPNVTSQPKYDLSDHNSKFHPGERPTQLKLIKRNNQTVLEQSTRHHPHRVHHRQRPRKRGWRAPEAGIHPRDLSE